MTTQTARSHPLPQPAAARARAGALARDARTRRAPGRARPRLHARAPAAFATVLWGALVLGIDATQARPPHAHAHKPAQASAPSTEQILAPSATTVPDALPVDRQVWRCGNSYSAHPCAGAATKPLDVADGRSDAQRRQSVDLTARDKRLASWYEAARHQREAVASAPVRARAPAASAACVDTTMMHCVPRKPRSRTVTSGAASSPPLAGRSP